MVRITVIITLFIPLSCAVAQTPNTTTFPCLDSNNINYALIRKHSSCSPISPWPNGYELWEMSVDSNGIRSPDGTLPRFCLFRPPQVDSSPKALLLMLHGGSSDRETPELPTGTLDSVQSRDPCGYIEFSRGFVQIAALRGYLILTPIDSWASQWAGCGEYDLDYGPRHYGSWIIEAAMHFMESGASGFTIDPNRVYIGGVCGGSIGAPPNGLRDSRIKKIFLDAHTDDPRYFGLAYPWAVSGFRHYAKAYPWEDLNGALSYSYAHHIEKRGWAKPTLLFQNRRDNISFSVSNKKLVRYMSDPRYFDQNVQAGVALEFDHDGPVDMFGHGQNLIHGNAALTFLWLEERRWWIHDALGSSSGAQLGQRFTNDNGDSRFNSDNCIKDDGRLTTASDGAGTVFEKAITLDSRMSNEVSVSAWYLTDGVFISPGVLEVLSDSGQSLARKDLVKAPLFKNRAVTEVTFSTPSSRSFTVRVTVNGLKSLLLDYILVCERESGDWGLEVLNGYFPD